jgi:cell division protein FtsL
MMQAVRHHESSSPRLIPEYWGSRGKEATRRRRRRSPVLFVLTIAALALLPFLAYIAETSSAAHIGYRILQLTQDIAALESEHERLQAIASSLRAPDRIERLATARLGLHAPRAGQIASLPLSQIASRRASPSQSGWWERFSAYFHRSDAAAAEPPR